MLAYTAQDGPDATYLAGLLVFWLALAIAPALVASNKGYSGFGFFIFGLVFWPLALICALLLTSKGKLNEHMRYDPYYRCWVTFDDAGRWYWHDGNDWQPFR